MPMSRTFTVQDQEDIRCYKGFDQSFAPGSSVDLVAIVMVEGEPETFVLDDTAEARREFIRFVANEERYQIEGTSILGIYRRGK